MKQALHSLFFLLLFLSGLSAQVSVSVDPNPWSGTLSADLSDEWSEVIAHANFTNNDAAQQSFRWYIDVQSAPAEWQFRICDNNACYGTSTVTNYDPNGFQEPVVLGAGESSILDLHVLPKGVAGTAIVHVQLSVVEDISTVLETAVYEVTIENSVATFDLVSAQRVRIYPNPATDYIALTETSGIDQIVVYNMIGRVVRTFDVANNRSYYMADLPDGLYLVSLVNREEGVIRTVRLRKQNELAP